VRVASGNRLGFSLAPVGAPGTAVALEELAVCGARRVVAIDLAAAIDASVNGGDVIVVSRALSSEGTSRHYAPGQRLLTPAYPLTDAVAAALKSSGIDLIEGLVWSTDAPYRETPSEVDEAKRQGAIAADMETSALFAAAAALGVEAAAVLVIADTLYGGWKPPKDIKAVNAKLRQVASAVALALSG
jgi:uridine phosphorylase